MYENIDEQVAVIASFGAGPRKIRPWKFKWQGKEYVITHVDYTYKYMKGQSLIYVFDATDGTNFFELHYDSANTKWLLGRVSDNEAH